MLSRRAVGAGIGVALVAAYAGLPQIKALLPAKLSFDPMVEPPGYRRLTGGAGGSTTRGGGIDFLTGIADRGGRDLGAAVAAARADLCAALFFDGRGAEGQVPVASFSDYYCPYCRVLTERIARLEETGAIAVSWHEWPVLGAASEVAARAALAARRQDAYAAFHARLMRSRFVATPEYLTALAESIDVDAGRLIADMEGPDVAGSIRRARALAQIFGFVGTPALVVGRTVVQGRIEDDRLARLIEAERGENGACGDP